MYVCNIVTLGVKHRPVIKFVAEMCSRNFQLACGNYYHQMNMLKNCDHAGSGSAVMLTVDISGGEIYLPL
jgi:hypothetical protein